MKTSKSAIVLCWLMAMAITPRAQVLVSPQVRTRAVADGKVTVVEIGAHFVSAIRLTEPVNSIAVGDPALFQVEHSEREPELVLVKALTERSSETNLLVSTIHGRQFSFLLVNHGSAVTSPKVDFLVRYRPAPSFLVEPDVVPFPLIGQTATIETNGPTMNYELEPAGDVAGMDFAVDQIPLVQPKPASVPQSPQPSPTEIFLAGKAVRLESARPSHKPVEITIRDIYERDGRLLVRYAVRNRGSHVYEMSAPQVYELTGVRYPQSLYPLVDSQLGDRESSQVTAKQQTPVPVLENHLQTEHVAPGQESLGVVALRLPSSTEPTILRFQFPNDEKQQIAVLLVR